MRLAYFSPFNPIRTGISDFSEELIWYLKKYIQIDLFIDEYIIENTKIRNEFNIININEYHKENVRKQYDVALFQLGNNAQAHETIINMFLKYGGIIEIHDIAMHHYLAETTLLKGNSEDYIRTMQYCHGTKGLELAKLFLEGNIAPPWETNSLKYSVCKHYIDKADAIIVHSDMAKQTVKAMNINKPVTCIPLHTPEIIENYSEIKKKNKELLKIEKDIVMIGSFGYMDHNKRISSILKAISKLKKYMKIKYFIVGKMQDNTVLSMINDLNIKNEVTITGFVTSELMYQYMKACDICINLRYPTQGESSSILHRMIGFGKPIVLTKIGTYEEYPDSFTFKIQYNHLEIEELINTIMKIIKLDLQFIGQSAIEYAKANCTLDKNAKKYFDFMKNVYENTFSEIGLDQIVDCLMQLKLLDEKYIDYLCKKI